MCDLKGIKMNRIQKFKKLKEKGIRISIDAKISKNLNISCEPPVSLEGELSMIGSIGAYTYIRSGCRIASGLKSIGRYCSIAPDTVIGDGNHPTDWLSTHPFQYGSSLVHNLTTQKKDYDYLKLDKMPPKIVIENDVWIGTGAKIMRGVKINNGAVIAAGSIVTKDVPPYAIVGGVPAKVIKYRFNEDIIGKLLALKWWEYEADSLLGVQFNDIDKAIEQVQKKINNNEVVKIKDEKIQIVSSDLL